MAPGKQCGPVSENRKFRQKLCLDTAKRLGAFLQDELLDIGGLADALDSALPKLPQDYYDEVLEMERERTDTPICNEPQRSPIADLCEAMGIDREKDKLSLRCVFDGAAKKLVEQKAFIDRLCSEVEARAKENAELHDRVRAGHQFMLNLVELYRSKK